MKQKIQDHFKGRYRAFYERYVEGIGKTERNGWLQCLCPLHPDSNPSFSFSNESGAFTCFGCGQKGDVFTFYQKKYGCDFQTALAELGKLAGVNGNGNQRKQKKGIKGNVVAKFVYTDEQGNPLHRTVKIDPKDFYQERYDPKKGWVKGLGKTRLVLYNLPQVLKAEQVFYVEGEKDQNGVTRLDFDATTNPMGAEKLPGQQEKHNILDPLKGKRVFILPDNDDPGRKHAEQAASLLYGQAKEIRIVNLPGLPEGGTSVTS